MSRGYSAKILYANTILNSFGTKIHTRKLDSRPTSIK